MLRMLSGDDPIEVKTVTLAVFGQPGIGKTSLAYSAGEKPLVLDFGNSAHRAVNRREGTSTAHFDSWKDLRELYSSQKALLSGSDVIVIDTVGQCLEMLTASILEETPKLGQSDGTLSQKGWGTLRAKWSAFMTATRALGKDLVLIAHDKEKDDGDAKIVRPDIQGGSYGEVVKGADAIAYYYMAGNSRTLDFNPSDRWIGKNPARWSPFPVPNYSTEPLFLQSVIAQLKAHLNQQAQKNADATKGAKDWKDRVAQQVTPSDLNGILEEVRKLREPLRGQVKTYVNDWAKAHSWTWDAKAKAFVGPAEEVFA